MSARKILGGVLSLAGKSNFGGISQRDVPGWLLNYGVRAMSSLPPHLVLEMPSLSPTMSQGNLASWHVKVGDEVTAGDVLADVETDKATLGFETQDEGVIAKLLIQPGTKDIPVGMPIAILAETGENLEKFKDFVPKGGSVQSEGSTDSSLNQPTSQPPNVEIDFESLKIGPAARKLMLENGIGASHVLATGPKGIITKEDVLKAIQEGPKTPPEPKAPPLTPPAPPQTTTKQVAQTQAPKTVPPLVQSKQGESHTDLPTSQIRRIIAERLLESKQTIPSLYATMEVELDGVSALRATMKEQGKKVSVNDFVVRAVALSLRDVPEANAFWDAKNGVSVKSDAIDVAIAVATPSGLITPIVKGADNKSLMEISAEVRELAKRAKENKLLPEEFMGGSFSISNLGMFGTNEFSAIINPPQAGIMAVGGATNEVYLKGGKPASRSKMAVRLSVDNRVYDDEIVGAFLNAFSSYFSSPMKLVL